jgi:hypothetical protein
MEVHVLVQKSKVLPSTFSAVRSRNIMLVISMIVLLMMLYTTYNYIRARGTEHCAMIVQPEGAVPVSNQEMHCFSTQVEALRYATSGKIDLPSNASQSDIDYALQHQSP